jgi:uncharacterized protein YceH (UPF0502 family)
MNSKDWTPDYVAKLQLDYGWAGVAHNHNVELEAASESEDRRLEDLAIEIVDLKRQLDTERKDKERWRLACNSKSSHDRILQLEQQLAAASLKFGRVGALQPQG